MSIVVFQKYRLKDYYRDSRTDTYMLLTGTVNICLQHWNVWVERGLTLVLSSVIFSHFSDLLVYILLQQNRGKQCESVLSVGKNASETFEMPFKRLYRLYLHNLMHKCICSIFVRTYYHTTDQLMFTCWAHLEQASIASSLHGQDMYSIVDGTSSMPVKRKTQSHAISIAIWLWYIV